MTRDNRSDVWLQPLVISALQSNGRTDGAICYAPLSQLETERAVLADVKREAAEIIAGLHSELAELRAGRPIAATETYHLSDMDGPHALARAWLEYRCVKCGETLLSEGSEEPIDGLESDLNGFIVVCKCGAEYVGSTPETASLFIITGEDSVCDSRACAEAALSANEIISRLSAVVDGDCTGCVDLDENKSGNCHDCARRKDDMFKGKS